MTTGPDVEAFEKKLCEQSGAKFAVVCSNGTTALHLACLALGIKKKDVCITSPITFLASANCVEYCNGKVDFVDIDKDTLCLSVKELKKYCEEKKPPKVVIPVDFAGVPANLPAIWSLAKKYGFQVIEDAAHSIGSSYIDRGKTYFCGSCHHSNLAIFSFHPVKNITTAEGGAVLTNDKLLYEKLKLFRSHGMTKDKTKLLRNEGEWYYEMHELGFNYRLTDMQCALGISQLDKLESIKDKRQKIVKKYNAAFSKNAAFELPPWPKNSSPCFHLYPIRFLQGKEVRARVYSELKKAGIYCQVHYFPVHLQPYYQKKYGFKAGQFPNAETYYSQCLSLPLFPAMTDKDVSLVIKNINRIVLNK